MSADFIFVRVKMIVIVDVVLLFSVRIGAERGAVKERSPDPERGE